MIHMFTHILFNKLNVGELNDLHSIARLYRTNIDF